MLVGGPGQNEPFHHGANGFQEALGAELDELMANYLWEAEKREWGDRHQADEVSPDAASYPYTAAAAGEPVYPGPRRRGLHGSSGGHVRTTGGERDLRFAFVPPITLPVRHIYGFIHCGDWRRACSHSRATPVTVTYDSSFDMSPRSHTNIFSLFRTIAVYCYFLPPEEGETYLLL